MCALLSCHKVVTVIYTASRQSSDMFFRQDECVRSDIYTFSLWQKSKSAWISESGIRQSILVSRSSSLRHLCIHGLEHAALSHSKRHFSGTESKSRTNHVTFSNYGLMIKSSAPGSALQCSYLDQVIHTHTRATHQEVPSGSGLRAVIPYGWKGNCGPGKK